MWACVRRYDNNPELAEILAARSDEIKGLVSGVEGFVSYYLIHDGKDTVSMTVAHNKTGVDEANVIAMNWLADHAADVPTSPPHITEGEVLITTSS